MTTQKIYISFLSLLFLLLGACIYIFFRQDTYFVQQLPFEFDLQFHPTTYIEYFLVYCLPDGLWYASLLLMQTILLSNTLLSKIILIMAVLCPFILELGQFAGILYGTYDTFDILTYFTVLLILYLCYRKHLKSQFKQYH